MIRHYDLPYLEDDLGVRWSKAEDLWGLAFQYARDNGLECDESFGVVGVAPT